MPIGEASRRTHDANGLALWTLRIGKEEILGQWVIVDQAFVPALRKVGIREHSVFNQYPAGTGQPGAMR